MTFNILKAYNTQNQKSGMDTKITSKLDICGKNIVEREEWIQTPKQLKACFRVFLSMKALLFPLWFHFEDEGKFTNNKTCLFNYLIFFYDTLALPPKTIDEKISRQT